MSECINCKWWLKEVPSFWNKHPTFGKCKRYPPLPMKAGNGDVFSSPPMTHMNDYCGEYKPVTPKRK